MPIRPENLHIYGTRRQWRELVAKVRERSGNCCEGTPTFPDCRRPNGWHLNKRTGELTDDPITVDTWSLAGDKVTRIVLTTAHREHNKPSHDPADFMHLCQRCHLAYDAEHHQQTARATRRANKAAGDMFKPEANNTQTGDNRGT